MGADGHVRIEISGDSKPLEKDLQRAEKECSDSLSEIGKESQKTEKALEDMGEAAKDAGDSKVTGGLEDVADALADIGDSAGDAGKGVEDTGKKAESAWKKLEGVAESAAELQDALSNAVKQSITTVGKPLAVVGAGVAAAVTATTGLLTNLGNGYNKAVNQIGAATGATGEDLKQLGQIAQNVYSHNFGDSLEDVADGIAVVRQNTQLMGEELEQATEAGFALRDTFGYDLSESARTASALMKNFNIDAEKAYNIIATGAQKGADQNGDLLDTLNEYSTQYAALGLSADQFINGLISGAEAGVFSIDKVGDAVKEFNIRAKDGSESTTSAFAALKLDADKTMQAFAQGGDTAQKTFFKVVKALESMEDPVQKNQTAVALFGTKYEDLEQTVLPVLASMESASEDTYDALGEINEIKYEDLGSTLQGLKRTIEGALIPAASEIASGPMMDAMKQLQKMVNDLAESIKAGEFDSVFEGIADGITGVVKALPKIGDGIRKIAPVVSNIAKVVTGFLSAAIDNIDLLVPAIAGIGTAIAALKILTFIGDVIKAVQALGAAFTLSTGTIGLAVLAISGLVEAIAAFAGCISSSEEKTNENTTATKELCDSYDELSDSIARSQKAGEERVATAGTEAATAEYYADKLAELAKKEHRSADEKERMKYYVDQLNGVLPDLGLEYDEEKDRLNKSTDAIYRNIEARKRQAKANAYQENYDEAVKNEVKLQETKNKLTEQWYKNQSDVANAQREYATAVENTRKRGYDFGDEAKALGKLEQAKKNLEETSKALADNNQALEENAAEQKRWGDGLDEIANEQALIDSIDDISKAAKDAGIKIPKSVKEGMQSGKYVIPQSVDELSRLIEFDSAIQKAGLQGADIPESLSQSINSGEVSVAEAIQRLQDVAAFDGMVRKFGVASDDSVKEMRDGLLSGTTPLEKASAQLKKVVEANAKPQLAPDAKAAAEEYEKEFYAHFPALKRAGAEGAEATKSGAGSVKFNGTGSTAGKGYASGVASTAPASSAAGKKLGTSAKSGAGSVSLHGTGVSLGRGLASGLASTTAYVCAATVNLVGHIVATAKKKAEVNSPSKLMRREVGLPLAEGLADGMQKGTKQATAAAADMVDSAMDAAKAKINTSKLTLSPEEAQAAIAADIDSITARGKLAVQYEMDRRAASVAAQAAGLLNQLAAPAAPAYDDGRVLALLRDLVEETRAGKTVTLNDRILGESVNAYNRRMRTITGGN